MPLTDIMNAALYGLGAFLAAFAALALMAGRARAAPLAEASDIRGDSLVFLIRDAVLIDMNFSARRFLDSLPDLPNDLDRLRAAFLSLSADTDLLFSADPAVRDHSAASRDGALQILRETSGKSIRIKVLTQDRETPGMEDVHRLSALESELETLRANTHAAPFLAWRQTPEGDVTWVNRAYLDTVDALFGPKRRLDWPLPALFRPQDTRRVESAGRPRRIATSDEAGDPGAWFDCTATPVGSETLFTAVNADDTVRAERQLRDFTQTLTKTFADLAVGLAIFDRSRQLVLFNPALTELSTLPVDFLAGRPTLEAFLDGLRERRMMPEPKDYRSWRASITDLEAAAQDGQYCETWSLPGNQTYRVSGRPHPDGAIAFLFEDITSEMALTRRFRSELELQHAVFDTLDDAIAIFTASGTLAMANDAYVRLWETGMPSLTETVSVIDATRLWHSRTLPTPIWGDFRDFAQSSDDRGDWIARVQMRDGRGLDCKFSPAPNGATLAVFRTADATLKTDDDLREAV